jgi:hypothetical protein
MGIVLIPLGIVVGGLYLWVAVKGTRWAYRKFSILGALAAVIAFLLVPTWDTIANHWYHKYVICARSDVGLHIYERVRLPSNYFDDQGRFREPEGWFSGRTLVGDRYRRQSGNRQEGLFPLTKYEKRFSGVLDTKEQRLISYEVDYLTQGGGWWLIIFRPLFSQVDYLTYVRGMIDGVTCGAIRQREREDSSASSVNAAFEKG